MAGLNLYQHKVFTKQGWKSYEDYLFGSLCVGDDILIFNPHNELYEWSPLLGIDFNPNDKRINLLMLDKVIEFGASQTWLIDIEFPPDLQLNNKYGLVNSNTLNKINSSKDSFGITGNKSIFQLQVGLIDLDLDLDLDLDINQQLITLYKESKFSIKIFNDTFSTWSPITLYHNALIQTQELILLLGCTKLNTVNSGSPFPYALSKTLTTSSNLNLSEFEGIENQIGNSIKSIVLNSINSNNCFVCKKDTGTPISLPLSIPYSNRNIYEIRSTLNNLPNGLICTFRVKDVSNNISLNEGEIRTYKYREDINDSTLKSITSSINSYDIVIKSTGNQPNGYLQLDSLSQIPPSIKIKWDSLLDIPKLQVSWEDILNKPIFRIGWDEIERLPTVFPTSWKLIINKPVLFNTSWELISNKPEVFLPAIHSHSEYANKIHTHTLDEIVDTELFVKRGDNIALLENYAEYITLKDITPEFITSLIANGNGQNINAKYLGGHSSTYYTNANNITTGIIGSQRLPLFDGDVYSFINPTNLLLKSTGVNTGTYTKISVDEKGRVLQGSLLITDDIPELNTSKITTGVFNIERLPLATFTTPGIITLSNSYEDESNNTVPVSSVIKDIYDITQTLIPYVDKGIPNGVASLDQNGLIPFTQLPFTLKEVTLINTFSDLPTKGENDHIYITIDTQQLYIWNLNEYKSIISKSSHSLLNARNISMNGDGTWSVSFDGTQSVTNEFSLTPSGVIPGTYTKVIADEKGRVIEGNLLETKDLPFIDGGHF